MKNINQFIIFIYFLMLCSCFQNDSKNTQSKNSSVHQTTTNIERTEEFLSQETLLKYRDEAQIIDFPYQDFGFHDSLKFNKVIAYEFDGTSLRMEEGDDDESSVFLNESGYSKRVKKQHQLDYDEVEQLLSIFTLKKYFGGLSALCFDPKLGFVFYDNSKVVNVIDICLDCNDFHLRRDFLPHKTFVPGMDIDNWESVESFNVKGVQGIKKLCKSLDFEYANFKIEEIIFEED